MLIAENLIPGDFIKRLILKQTLRIPKSEAANDRGLSDSNQLVRVDAAIAAYMRSLDFSFSLKLSPLY
jgi:hypothetical protein